MGQVFLGVSRGGRPVAVKAIRAELAADPQFRTRFGREIAAARKVSGVFTAMVVDADVDGPVAWLATAYVPGPSLDEAVHDHGPLPEGSLLALAAGLAESLTAIHAAGVVHQDLKPSNVLLAEDGPRVIDFGISHAAESTALAQTDMVAGSPGFMSPEQALGGQAGPQSDIFSLGAVLVFAATGEGPFGTGTTAALLYRVVHESPGLDRVPAAVRPLVERCLAKDPAQRPTAEALLAEVGALQPHGNWLPDAIIRSFTPATAQRAAFALSGAALATSGSDGRPQPEVTSTQITGSISAPRASVPAAHAPTVTSASLPPPPPGGARDQLPPRRSQPRRGPRRPLVLACGIGAILVISAFTLTSGSKDTPTAQDRPAVPASSPAAPAPARHTAASKKASPSPSKTVYSPAAVVPAVVTTPSPSPSVRKSASPKPSTPKPKPTTPSPSPTRTTSSPFAPPTTSSPSAPPTTSSPSAPPTTTSPSTPPTTTSPSPAGP
jgi:serine/threonine protein kinase